METDSFLTKTQPKPARGARLLDALFPPRLVCFLCGNEDVIGEDGLCAACRRAIKPAPMHEPPPDVFALVSAYSYTESVPSGVHALKYGREIWRAPLMAEHIRIPADWQFDCIVPIPLHFWRLFLRTFNQSEALASRLASLLGVPMETKLVRRVRNTPTQTALHESAREKNVAHAFCASPAVFGRSVLLIDDVTTTGATLSSCANALMRAGAIRVYAACFAAACRRNDGSD